MRIKLIFFAILLMSATCHSSEDSTGGYKCFSNAYVKQVVFEVTGYVAIKVVSSTNSSEVYWVFIDPTLGTDAAKQLLSAALTAQSSGSIVDVVYWGTNAGLSHYFFAYPNSFVATRRLHTFYLNE